ncbi:MAG: sigma-70 family RNA polymerase sigma factor [Myxococcota bacterium]
MDDAALYSAWADGDRARGAELVGRYLHVVWRFFANKAPQSADVEDLVATTFERCARSLGTLQKPDRFRSYLYGIAANVLRDHVRKRRPTGSDSLLEVAVADLSPSPSAVAVHRQQERLLLEALRAVSLEHQLVLELSLFEDLSRAEIAEVLALPPGTVAGRLRRARILLEERIHTLAENPELRRSTTTSLDDWAKSIRTVLEATRQPEAD